jgi:glycosyltransferase involved in cell wall biosynthesis
MIEPRVIIGAAVYNHEAEAREAFESLLGQTCRDFALVVVDDASTDATPAIAEEYARRDPRVTVHRNERRVGMIDNWRRAFRLAHSRYPHAEYFAWASDHDLWHPRWLSVLLDELDRHPEAVLAYPLNTKVFPDGRAVDRKPWYFDTAGLTDPRKRLARAGWDMSAGNMIYGLFRIGPLVRAGVFRRVLVPDRMLLTELSLYGQFRQVRQILWQRRWYGRVFSVARQRASFFPAGRPLAAYLPWWLSHTIALAWHLVVRGSGRPQVGRWLGARLAVQHLRIALPLHTAQGARALRTWAADRWTVLRRRHRQTIGPLKNGPC